MPRNTIMFIAVATALVASGCADANLAQDNLELCARGLSGFWWGLWHGIVAPFSFVGSLFKPEIAIYDICNNGGWYDFGFCLGVGAFTKGGHSAATQTRRRRRKRRESGD